jgi:glutathione S-transferase
MVMAEGEIEYQLNNVDIFNNEHHSPEFLALNPAGFVPLLVKADGETMYETPAINLYLAEQHKLTHLAPAIDDPDRGRFLSSLFFLSDDLEPIIKRFFYPNRYVLHDQDEPAMRLLSLQQALERIGIIDQQLQQEGPYQLGPRFSLVDIILCFWAEYLNFEQNLDPYPALRRCQGLVMSRPLLRPFFNELIECRTEYLQKQANGGGVK